MLVSSDFASPASPFFYAKMKGDLEEAVKSLGFEQLSIFNPPVLQRKNTDRSGELLWVKVLHSLNRAGLFLSQRPLPTEVLAQAMVNTAKASTTGVATYKQERIWQRAEMK